MAVSPVRVGIVGLGHNGLAHLQAHLSCPLSRVVAICDRDPSVVEKAGEQFGVHKRYSDDGIFTDPEIDAVSIHTDDPNHRDPFISAIRAGKHVLVEKPLANTEEDVHAMVAAAQGADPALKIQVGYILRFNPVYEEVHGLAAQGTLGRIYYMEADYVHNLLYQATKTNPATGHNWYLEQELPMVGGGSHPLDLLRWISGKEVVRVRGYASHEAFPAMANDDCQVCLFQFEDGTIAKVAALYGPRSPMPPFNNLRIYGTNGTVERDTVAVSASPEDVHPDFQPVAGPRVEHHPYLPEIEDWLQSIQLDRPTRTPLWDGANSTIAALTAVRALRTGVEEDVPSFRTERPTA